MVPFATIQAVPIAVLRMVPFQRYPQIRGYRLFYDEYNRLTQANYGEGPTISNNSNRYNEYIRYDDNSNVVCITRYGKMQNGNYGIVDNLLYDFKGNQLNSVRDKASSVLYEGALDYKSKGEYAYDANGNMICDTSKGITKISYDDNGKPLRIQFSNGNVTEYIYSADGSKLRTTFYTAVPNITVELGKIKNLTSSEILYKDYMDYRDGGNWIYKNGKLDMCLFNGGYYKISDNNIVTYYYNKDHLGNNREVLSLDGTVSQIINYYAFGLPYFDQSAVQNDELQPYKYNGKEFDEIHGLNLYDYSARQYDPAIGQFTSMDPLCEKYYHISPYAYCAGNPVKYVDPDGRDAVSIIDDENKTITIKANYYVATNDKPSNVSFSGSNTCKGYTSKEISEMNTYSGYLNNLCLTISEGDYTGYSLKFDLNFIDGGSSENCQISASDDKYENVNIGNTFEKYDETVKVFRPKENGDCTGGITSETNQNIVMNKNYDTKMNRLHEIGHTMGLDHLTDPTKLKGLMKYPPQNPNQADANNIVNNNYMKERRVKK